MSSIKERFMNYRATFIEDMETGIYTYVVQKKKWLVFWKDVYYADSERDAYRNRCMFMEKEK